MVGGWRTRRQRAVVLAALAVVCGGVGPIGRGVARADNLRHALRTAPSLVGVGVAVTPAYENAVDVILEQAARNLPIPSSSSGFTYRDDLAADASERPTRSTGATRTSPSRRFAACSRPPSSATIAPAR